MAIYKRPVNYKKASLKSQLCWMLYGFVAGFYSFQPLLKRTHREENSWLYDYLKKSDEEAVAQLQGKAKKANKSKVVKTEN